MSNPFDRTVIEVGGRAQTILTRDGRVWAMVETDCPTDTQFAEAHARASERYANR